MHIEEIKRAADVLFKQASFIWKIKTINEHGQALELVENLLDDYESNEPLIDLLSRSIEEWEGQAEEFEVFYRQVYQLTLKEIKKDNPDLTEDFIKSTLKAADEKKRGLLEPYLLSDAQKRLNTLENLSALDQSLHLGYEILADQENGKGQLSHEQKQTRLNDISDSLKARRNRKSRISRNRKFESLLKQRSLINKLNK